ncbi:MAG: exo-alpha-sialidase [Armatimonadota bacterium]
MSDHPPVRWELPLPDANAPHRGYQPVEGVEHTEIYHATPENGVYSHHAQLHATHDALLAMWSCHADGEDGPGQHVLWSVSGDGETWSPPGQLFSSLGPTRDATMWGRVLTANGWVTLDGVTHAVAEVHDMPGWHDRSCTYTSRVRTDRCPARIRIGHGRVARSVSATGEVGPIFWLVEDPPDPPGGFPRHPDAGSEGFAEPAARMNEALSHPLNQPAWEFRHWTTRPQASDGEFLCEPTTFQRPDGSLVRLARHLGRSHRLYAATSDDNGETWSPFVGTAIPDSPSKSVAGTLPDGRIYLIGNQVQCVERDPLTISLSDDGIVFDRAFAIRSGAPRIRFPGLHKSVGFQYPSAALRHDELWVLYSVGKEDVEVSRVPLDALSQEGDPASP